MYPAQFSHLAETPKTLGQKFLGPQSFPPRNNYARVFGSDFHFLAQGRSKWDSNVLVPSGVKEFASEMDGGHGNSAFGEF